jgi:M6 family metalloprotease-like protein
MKHSGIPRKRRLSARVQLGTVAVAIVATAVAGMPSQSATAAEPGDAPTMRAIDPQNWENTDEMTWEDYKAVPGQNYADPSVKGSSRQFKAALVLIDFPDQDFAVTLPPHSTVFGNPQALAHDIPRAKVAKFYEDFLNKPNDINRGHTMHEYWMEDSDGRYGIDLTAFGPYRVTGQSFQYGIPDGSFNPGACPTGFTCNRSIRTDGYAAWTADQGANVLAGYDQIFFATAGQDESSTWQEFGPMMWENREDVPDSFGPPDPALPNWARTRYVPWTSWKAAANHWPNASSTAGKPSSTQAESSGLGTYTHEMSHLLGIADNYNNPFGIPLQRSYTGVWGMLSRGSFNGPGGPHTRWQIPPTQGGSMGSQHMLRDKIDINMIDEDQVLRVSREALAQTGLAVVKIQARASQGKPGSGIINGLNVAIATDNQPSCVLATNPDCPRPFRTQQGQQVAGLPYNNYTVEIAQRIGADSFTPDTGALISLTKNQDTPPFVWIIDAHPEDIQMVDYYDAKGVAHMTTYGEFRQLSDAAFHAGTKSGSKYEYVAQDNRLHFYILDVESDAQGVVSYTVGVRSLDGSGPQARGVSASAGTQAAFSSMSSLMELVQRMHSEGATSNRTDQKLQLTLNQIRVREARGQFKQAVASMQYFLDTVEEDVTDEAAQQQLLDAAYAKNAELGGAGATSCTFPVTNTGAAGTSTGQPEDVTKYLDSDIYRLSVAATGSGWSAELPNALAAVKAGQTENVPVYVSRSGSAARSGSVTLTAVSESDPTKRVTATCSVAVNPNALT